MTPFIYSAEWLALLADTAISMSQGLTDLALKLTKEFFILSAIIVALFIPRRHLLIRNLQAPLIFGILTLITVGFSTAKSPLLFISGIRWALPFIICVSFIGICGTREIKILRNTYCVVFIFSFFIQLLQLASKNPTFGLNAAGFSERSAGIFTAPINAGLLAITVALLNWIVPWRWQVLNYILAALAIISVILTRSGTALISASILMILQIAANFRLNALLAIALSAVGGIGILTSLPLLTARESILSNSGTTRLDILSKTIEASPWFYGNFGNYTNTAILLSSSSNPLNRDGVVADSMISSAIGNLGLVPGLIVFSLLLLLIMVAGTRSNYRVMGTATVLTLFSMSLNLSESFPANLAFAILLAYQIPSLLQRQHD